jgi:purine-binding chemotaxis protein CheW
MLLCAFPLGQIVEIMRALPIETLSGPPAFVLGATVVRGAAVPVVDVGHLISGPRHAQGTAASWMISLRLNTGGVVLAVDHILGVERLSPDEARDLPPLLKETAAEAVSAIGTLDSELLLFLNVAKCLPFDLMNPTAEGTPS